MSAQCYVKIGKEEVLGEFVGMFQYSYPMEASPLRGGPPAGFVAYPVALVRIGDVYKEVRSSHIRFKETVMEGVLAVKSGQPITDFDGQLKVFKSRDEAIDYILEAFKGMSTRDKVLNEFKFFDNQAFDKGEHVEVA